MSNADQSRSEKEIERLRAQLAGANADFEEFVSMAAHNLRQSLRDIEAYSQLMSETYSSRLDSEAGVFLAHIQEGAASIQSLLADVVDYWAADDRNPASSRTDMEAAFVQALLCAGKQITERRAVVTHDPLPQVTGIFELLTKVLHHLIRNAIEYSVAVPRVHVSCKQADGEWVFSVADNGPGIEPAFHERIFQVFKRLHGKEHPGNGLGLAFCKKAIGAHGGRIWVGSTPGTGSTFYFTLSRAE